MMSQTPTTVYDYLAIIQKRAIEAIRDAADPQILETMPTSIVVASIGDSLITAIEGHLGLMRKCPDVEGDDRELIEASLAAVAVISMWQLARQAPLETA